MKKIFLYIFYYWRRSFDQSINTLFFWILADLLLVSNKHTYAVDIELLLLLLLTLSSFFDQNMAVLFDVIKCSFCIHQFCNFFENKSGSNFAETFFTINGKFLQLTDILDLSLTYKISAIWLVEKSTILTILYSWCQFCTVGQKDNNLRFPWREKMNFLYENK